MIPRDYITEWRVHSYDLDELLGTKMRALFQRKQGRDLFDLAIALAGGRVSSDRIVGAFLKYMDHEGQTITRAQFEENIALKMQDPAFLADISPLLAANHEWNPKDEAAIVSTRLIERLPGDPWKRTP